MKNPREILFERHRHAERKLDVIRAQVLAERGEATASHERGNTMPCFHPIFVAAKMWRELFLPCRRVWLGLSAAWVVIVFVNVLAPGDRPASSTVAKGSKPSAEFIAALREQKQFLAQLLETGTSPQPALPPRSPAKRSERRETVMVG